MTRNDRTLVDFYRCPEEFAACLQHGEPSPNPGYFRLGSEGICYGSLSQGKPRATATEELHDASKDTVVQPGKVSLSFDPDQIVEDLRVERYCANAEKQGALAGALVGKMYYLVRPLLGVGVRRYLQRLRLKDWGSIPFPKWPVDTTVEHIHETLLRLCIRANGGGDVPFIWFWPKPFSSCIAITHDVEEAKGLDFCPALMDLDESFGIKSSFQLIPESRYSLSTSLTNAFRSRGFELNIHDLNHDGRLFANEAQFLQRVRRINEYGRAFNALGFRSGALYRNPAWFGALDFAYEMSIPNVAHLDPQRGGCCTVMPYFIGNLLELPLTTTQDYSLFQILNDYSINLWRRQLDSIGESHGMATFNVHPDYIIASKARSTYIELLRHIADLRARKKIWVALPGEINQWWRNRARMRIVRRDGQWTIEGPDSQRAQLAYASLRGNELRYPWVLAGGDANGTIGADSLMDVAERSA